MTKKCSQCGTDNTDDARFCDKCGYVLEDQPVGGGGPITGPGGSEPEVEQGNQGGGNQVEPGLQCPNPLCRAPLRPEDEFCPSCGERVKPATPPIDGGGGLGPIVEPLIGLAGRFTVLEFNEDVVIPAGKTEATIGRQDPQSGAFPEVDLDKFDAINKGVSRRHCKLSFQGGIVYVEDLNSVNHTFLRQQQLTPGQKYALNDGDEIVLGKLRLVYHVK